MAKNIFTYGKSQFAEKVSAFFETFDLFNIKQIEHFPSQKVDGLILCFLEGLTVKETIELGHNVKKGLNDIIFISTFSNKQIILGTTFLSNENTASVDTVFDYLLFNKYKFSNNHKVNNIKLPKFDVILNDAFYKKSFYELANKLLREVNVYFSDSVIQCFYYTNKVELIYIITGRTEEEFIYPTLENSLNTNESNASTKHFKVVLSDFFNSEEIIKRYNVSKIENLPLEYENVGVIGGGTAGYLTALALKQRYPDLKVTIVESSKIPIIGVGEATTPIIRKFLFNELKINKLDFYSKVQPTWKLGIKFFWGLPDDYYFNYPFGASSLLPAFLNGNINNCSLNSVLMSKDASFVYRHKSENEYKDFSLSNNLKYAYHLDNKKFVAYLKAEALKRGIFHKDAEINNVVLFQDKDGVDYIKTKAGEDIKFDFYVDCTGFKSLLMGEGLGSKYISYKKSLYTDSAIVANVPNNDYVKPYTYAESMINGWCWNIPLRDSDHRGYVYCSDYCSEEEAVNEMKKRNPNMGEHRLIKFKSGRHEHFVRANVAAVGNSHGFVEPLESTGIHMIIKEAQALRDNFELLSTDTSNTVRNLLNENINSKWDYLRWFLSIHYKFNKKYESDFWKDCRQNVDTSGLDSVMDAYKNLGLLFRLPNKIKETLKKQIDDDLFGFAGVDNILLGQGVVPKNIGELSKHDRDLWQHHVSNWNQLADASVDLKEDIDILTNNPALI